MKKIILTGATGGIGHAIAIELLNTHEYEIYGIGRRSSKIVHLNYHPIQCDLNNLQQLEMIIKPLKQELTQLDAIILAAGYGKFTELEQFSVAEMQTMLNVNFLSQAVLVKHLLTLLKKTQNSKLIAVGSEAAIHGAKKGSMYCASKFALRGFLQSLRAECTQSETAVTLINPGLVATEFFNTLNFAPGNAAENSINISQIAKTIEFILAMENNCVVEEINLQPIKKVIQKKGVSI